MPVSILVALAALSFGGHPAWCDGEGVSLVIAKHRPAFYRGEKFNLEVTCSNSTVRTIEAGILEVRLRDVLAATAKVGMLASGKELTISLPISTTCVRIGDYSLRVELKAGSGVLATAAESLTVAKRPNPERLPVWLWAYGGPLGKFYQEHGFTVAGGPYLPYDPKNGDLRSQVQKTKHDIDARLPTGMDISIIPVGGLWKREFGLMKPEGPDTEYLGAGRDGDQYYNPFSPIVAKSQDDINSVFMDAFKDSPHVRFAFVDMEYVDDLWLDNRNERGIEQTKKMLGFTKEEIGKPNFVAPGVVADNDRLYLYHKYVYRHGNGVSLVLKRAADMVHKYRPDVQFITDPYRSTALLDMFPGVDIIETWTYTQPDPKLMLYVETMRAVCKPTNQIPFNLVTLLNYPGWLAPTKDWMLMGPDTVKVTTWINLSRAPKIVGYYYSGSCNPEQSTPDEFRVPHATSDAIKELSDKVFKPYGPMIRNLVVEPRKIAVLSSQVSRLYGKSPTLVGYGNYEIYPFYSVMAMAHLQADVLFDEHIERYGLNDYKVLVLPKCDVLTKSVYDKILDFQKRGGLIIADQYLGPDFPGVIKFDFDVTYRRKVTADAIANNKAYAEWDDHLQPGSAELKTVAGVTAMDDQRIMESYAARLKKGLAGRVDPDVDCDAPTVLFNMLEKDGVKYLVIVNDRRTYDDRVGKYKGILGKIEPQTITVNLKKWQLRELYAYDMLEQKALPIKRTQTGPQFTVSLDELGGKIIALYPRKLEGLTIETSSTAKAGKPTSIRIHVTDRARKTLPGLQPLQVTLTDPKGNVNDLSDYYCAKNGLLELSFRPAMNDEVGRWSIAANDLTSGLKASNTFSVAR